MTVTTSDHVSLHVDVQGKGPVVLFSHGLSGSARNWRATMAALPAYHCIAYDVLGHSRSDVPKQAQRYEIECLVQDMVDILDHFKVDQASLVGLSMGSALSLSFALKHPDRVKSMVLSSFPNQDPAQGGVSGYAQAFSKAILEEGLEKAGERFVWGEQSSLSARDASMVRLGYLANSEIGIANILRGLFVSLRPVSTYAPDLGQLKMPVCLLSGERDVPSVNASETLSEYLPNAQRHVIPNGGHLINLDSKKIFNERLQAFFEEVYSMPVKA